MANIRCDLCDDEPGKLMVGDQDDGSQTSVGLGCMPLLGLTFIRGMDAATLDAALNEIGYQPSKRLKDERKAAQLPEYPVGESVLDIVEDRPRPPGDESTDTQGDQSPRAHVDNDQPGLVTGPAVDPNWEVFDPAAAPDAAPVDPNTEPPPY